MGFAWVCPKKGVANEGEKNDGRGHLVLDDLTLLPRNGLHSVAQVIPAGACPCLGVCVHPTSHSPIPFKLVKS